MKPNLDAFVAEKCRRSFYYFCQHIFPALENGHELRKSWWLEELCRHLEKCESREITRLMILIAPRHGKSILVRVLFPAWVLFRNHGQGKFLGTTYKKDFTERDSRKLRTLIETPEYQKLVRNIKGPNWAVSKTNRKISSWYTTEDGAVHSFSLSGTTGEGADYLLIDDLMSVTIANSPADRANALTYYEETLPSRLNPPPVGSDKRGVKIIINQCLNEDDLVGRILVQNKNREGYEVINIPSRFSLKKQRYPSNTSLNFKDQRTTEGEILCPITTPKELLDEIEEIAPYVYWSQYQQDPIPRGGAVIKKDWWTEITQEEIAKYRRGEVIVSYDLTFGTDDEDSTSYNARVSLQIFQKPLDEGVGYSTHVFLLGGEKNKKGFKDMAKDMYDYDNEFKPDWTIIEKKAAGVPVLSVLRNQLLSRIHEFDPTKKGKKRPRMEAIAGMVPDNFYYDPSHEPSAMIVDSICKFPHGLEDDIADAFSQACTFLRDRRIIRLREDRDYIQTLILGDQSRGNPYTT